jgi:CheY-like chemotaxis protein
MIKTILLVDDDGDDAELFREALEEIDASFKFERAKNGYDALERLERIDLPSYIFLDVNMPRMNGWECIDKLKKNPVYKNIPVYMYSTSSEQEEIEKAKASGAEKFFSKPYSYRELKNTLVPILQNRL